MKTRNRIVAALSAVFLTVAIAVAAVMAGGARGGSAAPADATPAAVPAAATPQPAQPAAGGNTWGFSVGGGGFMGGGFMTGSFGDTSFAMPPMDFAAFGDIQGNCDDFAKKVAANLNVTTDQLGAAVKKAKLQGVDEAQAAGKLTADQAQKIKDRINSPTEGLCGGLGIGIAVGGPGFPGGMGFPGGAIGLHDDAMTKAAAAYFGLSTDQFMQDLKDKGSLQGVAAKYTKDTADGKAGLEKALENALRQQLKDRGVDQAKIDQKASDFKQNFDSYYTAKFILDGPFGPGGHPGFPGGGQRSPHPSATPTN